MFCSKQIDLEESFFTEGEKPLLELQERIRRGEDDAEPGPESIALQRLLSGLVWTRPMRRMYALVDRCLQYEEPALLVGDTGTGKTTVCQIAAFVRHQRLHIFNCNQHTETSDLLGGFRPNRASVEDAAVKRAPFIWVDGPLVEAMRNGDILLIDELNLAEDAVLERLNSVLEPSRTITLAEKGGSTVEVVVAHPAFRIVATMNPGGDFGKKELSPALSNRFTTVWVPTATCPAELEAILAQRLLPQAAQVVTPRLIEFWEFFNREVAHAVRQVFSMRDLMTWVEFINRCSGHLDPLLAYAHGAELVLLDGLGLGSGVSVEVRRFLCVLLGT